jgi:hypothetical protein
MQACFTDSKICISQHRFIQVLKLLNKPTEESSDQRYMLRQRDHMRSEADSQRQLCVVCLFTSTPSPHAKQALPAWTETHTLIGLDTSSLDSWVTLLRGTRESPMTPHTAPSILASGPCPWISMTGTPLSVWRLTQLMYSSHMRCGASRSGRSTVQPSPVSRWATFSATCSGKGHSRWRASRCLQTDGNFESILARSVNHAKFARIET